MMLVINKNIKGVMQSDTTDRPVIEVKYDSVEPRDTVMTNDVCRCCSSLCVLILRFDVTF